MIEAQYLNTLRKIVARLEDSPINWVVTGSLGMALQSMDMEIHDVDIQTDKDGAYEIERRFSDCVVKPIRHSTSDRIRSYFGVLDIDGIRVEIMGDIQKRLDGQGWEEPVKIERYRRWVEIKGMWVPVLSLEYEYQAYLRLGRRGKAAILGDWLKRGEAG